MEILERIVDSIIQQVVSIDDTSRELSQEEHYRCNRCGAANAGEISKSEQIDFMAFLDLEKQLTVSLENLSSES